MLNRKRTKLDGDAPGDKDESGILLADGTLVEPVHDYHTLVVRDRTWSFVVFQATAAAMLGGTIISALVAASDAFGKVSSGAESGTVTYSASLSAAICGVAYANYSAMTATRLRTIKQCRGEKKGVTNEGSCRTAEEIDGFVITTLRYSDWVVTFPLLALKLFEMACDGPDLPTHSLLTTQYIHALVGIAGLLMIVFGFVSLVATGDFEGARTDTMASGLIRWTLCLLGMGCLAFQYVVLFTAVHETKSVHANEVIGFALVWALYPAVFLLQIFQRIRPAYKDVAFALLDILSKPLLSVYIAQAALKGARVV